MDGDDVRVLQRGRGHGLGAEPLHRLRRRMRPEQEHLERDDAVQALLAGLVDHAHAAVRNLLQQLVVAEIAELRGARRCSESDWTILRDLRSGSRRLNGFAKAQAVEAPGAKPFRGVGGKLRATTRTCGPMSDMITDLISHSLQRESRVIVTRDVHGIRSLTRLTTCNTGNASPPQSPRGA